MDDLTIDDIELPNQVQRAIEAAYINGDHTAHGSLPFQPKFWAKVALLALAREPLVPTHIEIREMYDYATGIYAGTTAQLSYVLTEWQRRVFKRREPELPDEVKQLMWDRQGTAITLQMREEHDADVIAAYSLGKQAQK